MSFCIYRLAKQNARGRRLEEFLAQTITLAERARSRAPAKAAAAEAAKSKELRSLDRTEFEANLQGPEKLEKRFPVAGLELFKFLGDLLGFAFMAKNGVEQGDRGAVVHQARVQAHTP